MAADSTTNAIEIRGLEKRFAAHVALAGFDLDVPAGVCFGLLGPNGAGKSTTVGVLTTLLAPSAGTARVFGRDVTTERAAVRRDLGVVFQDPALDPELSPREQLGLHARLYRVEAPDRRVAELLERHGLEEHAGRPIRQLSGGLRRRIEIARGLLHRPRLLFLDEPTTGLDVAARSLIWNELRALRDGGETTLFLTTHSMEEADALCDTIAILDRGRIVASGAPGALKAELGGDVVTLVVEHGAPARAALESLAGVGEVALDEDPAGARLRVAIADGPHRLPALLEAVRSYGVIEVGMQHPSLEHVFLHHTGHPFEETDA